MSEFQDGQSYIEKPCLKKKKRKKERKKKKKERKGKKERNLLVWLTLESVTRRLPSDFCTAGSLGMRQTEVLRQSLLCLGVDEGHALSFS